MSPQKHEETIFEAALRLQGEERTAHLNAACGGDAPLRHRVELLLKSHEQASGDFLEKPRALGPNKTMIVSPLPVEELLGTMIGRYKLLEKVGEGGFGVVYVAEQREPVKRRVALKIIKLGMDTKQVVARFEVERQALALMDHPNIAKVFDAGSTEKGRPYFVMELVRGIRITEYCDQNNLSTKERLELFAKVCQAIQHAHQKGIIHRDIKPSNILVTLHDGVPVPKVIDFGIAKATQGELSEHTVYTQLQQFIGTPAYMSPEQAEMSGLDIDTRSDIYALGVLLYELLTGKTPFDQQDLLSAGLDGMRRMIREQEPQRPSTRVSSLQGEERTTTARRHGLDAPRLVHLLQGDLDWIVMKCLEKDRTRRYETANGVAMDLQRHLNNEPVVARPASAVYRFQKFARRNKLAFAAGAAVAVALCLGVIASTWQAVRATREQHIADRERGRAETEASRADENARAEARQRQTAESATHRANQALSASLEVEGDRLAREGNSAKALAHLARALRIDPANRVAAQRIISLLNQRDFPLPMPSQPTDLKFDPLGALACTPDLRRYCQPADSNRTSLAVFDGRDGRMIGRPLPLEDCLTERTWAQHNGSRAEVGGTNAKIIIRLSDDGSRLGVGLTNKTTFWECESGRKVAELKGQLELLSPDGKFAVVDDDRVVAVDSGRELFLINHTRGFATFSPDGQMLAYVSESNSLAQVLFTTNGQPVLPGFPTLISGAIPSVRFSPDGRRLIGSGSHGKVEVWDLTQQRQSFPALIHGNSVWAMECSTDGRLLATGTRSGRANLWKLHTGQPAREPCQSADTIWRTCLVPDTSWLATRSIGINATNFARKWQGARWWDIRTGCAIPIKLIHPSQVLNAAFSPDGSLVQTVCQDSAARIWSAQTGELICPPINHGGGVKRAIFGPDSTTLATGASGGDIRLWEARSGKQIKVLGRHETRISALAFSPDGRFLASGAADGKVKLWEIASGKVLGETGVGEPGDSGQFVTHLTFDRTGQRLVACYYSDHADICETPSLRKVAGLAKNQSLVFHAGYSPDGKWIATSSGLNSAQLWDAQTGEGPKAMYPHESGVFASDFSPDGRWLATASYDHTARVWETLTGKPITEPLPHQALLRTVFFSPDGRTVLTSSFDGSAMVWDAQTGRPVAEKFQHESGVNSACFSPDGRHILTAGKDGIAAIHGWVPLNEQPPSWLAELAEAVGGFRLSEAGVSEYLDNAAQILARLRLSFANAAPTDEVSIWGKWYLADRAARPVSPYDQLTVQSYAERLSQRSDLPGLEEALDLGSRNPLVYQKLAALLASSQPTTASLYQRIAENLGGTTAAPAALVTTTTPQGIPEAADHSPIDEVDAFAVEALLKHEGQFVRARGRIIAHATNRAVTMDYLNFSANYQSALSLIFRRTPDPSDIDPASLDGFTNQNVVVEGKIINFRGAPEIELTSLAQIRIEEGTGASFSPPAAVAALPVAAPAVNAAVPVPGTNTLEALDPRESEPFLKRENQIVKIKGRVVRYGAAPSARIHYLDFTDNFRAGLSLVFFTAQNPAEFRPELLRPYVNKTVVTEGKISTYQGRLQMEIKSLADLKIVEDAESAQKKE